MTTKKNKSKKEPTKVEIAHNTFSSSVNIDADAAFVMLPIADGLLETAKGLTLLAKLLNGHSINIEPLLKVESSIFETETDQGE